MVPRTPIYERASRIRMILTDVDGVLTDGRLIFDNQGNEHKCFNSRDGLGIGFWLKRGYLIGFVTRRHSEVVERRARELRITELYQNVMNKREILGDILHKYQLLKEEVAFIGDDLADYGIMRNVGLAVAPSDAAEEILKITDYVTSVKGGYGAVRELIELVLKTRGEWQEIVESFS